MRWTTTIIPTPQCKSSGCQVGIRPSRNVARAEQHVLVEGVRRRIEGLVRHVAAFCYVAEEAQAEEA